MPKCPACERQVKKLVNHHWFEKPDMVRHEKQICEHCNSLLTSERFHTNEDYEINRVSLNHVLPPWEEQAAFIKKTTNIFDDEYRILYRTYGIEAMPFDSDREGDYYQVILGFDSLEDAKRCLDKWIDAGDIQEGYWNYDSL